ncbi:defective in Cullin neddylation protein 1 [Lentinula edodes]|uniref:Defective in cullin neddylation protein n=1 Tax=Lentinula edodes TaxID=5353 RepID=A0A1Q3EHU6_LENED|nr:defective in Cullin neddylation protein 1 [Lentinula edodes]
MTFREQQPKDYLGPSKIPFSISVLALVVFALLGVFTLLSQKHRLKEMSSKSKASDVDIASFCSVTGASYKDAKKFLEKHKRLDAARSIDQQAKCFIRRIQSEDITINGTIKLCEDLEKDPEDVVLLAVAYELKAPEIGRWTRKGWVDGWKANGCDSLLAMKNAVARFGHQLSTDSAYFRKVYLYTFDLGRTDGARSLAMETAQAFWSLLIPHGLKGGALSHISSTDSDDDVDMNGAEGWRPEYTDWWFEFLNEKGGKGVSKDTWSMFLDFMRSIDTKFEKYDMEGCFVTGMILI